MYRMECSGQVSVQNEQRLKPYEGSPDADGQARPLLESARQPISRGRVARPREWEIPVHDPVKPDKAPRPLLPPGPPATPAPEPALVPGDAPQAEGGDPGTTLPLTPAPQSEVPMEFERQARSRRSPGYLADYHMGSVDLTPLRIN